MCSLEQEAGGLAKGKCSRCGADMGKLVSSWRSSVWK